MYLTIIGARFVSLRKTKGITQVKLAELIKLDRTYISTIEHGKQNLMISTLIFICDCLGITLKELFIFNSGGDYYGRK